MTTNQTGNNDSLNEEWARVLNQLDDYIKRIGLNLTQSSPVEKLLNMPYEELQALSKEECSSYSVILAQYSLFLQKEYNRHQSKYNWADNLLNVIVGQNAGNYGNTYTKFDEKRAHIIAENSYARELNRIMRALKTVLDDMTYISRKVEKLSDTYSELGRSK